MYDVMVFARALARSHIDSDDEIDSNYLFVLLHKFSVSATSIPLCLFDNVWLRERERENTTRDPHFLCLNRPWYQSKWRKENIIIAEPSVSHIVPVSIQPYHWLAYPQHTRSTDETFLWSNAVTPILSHEHHATRSSKWFGPSRARWPSGRCTVHNLCSFV